MEGEKGGSRSIFDEIQSPDIQGGEIEGQSGVTESIINELHSSDIQGDKGKVKVVLFEVSLITFLPWISKEINWKVKMVLLEV